MKRAQPCIAIVLVVLTIASQVWAASVTIGANKDNSIFRNRVNNSAGGSAGIFVGTTATSSPRRGLIAFDMAANVPAGVTITSAQLTLYLGMAGGGESKPVGLHRLTKDWGEGTAGNDVTTVRNAGAGFTAAPGDATWNANYLGTSLWSSPGAAGDFNPAASSTAIITDIVDTPFTWLSTSALVSDVQNWLDHPTTNFGWAMINGDEVNIATARAFYSREATVDASGDPMDVARRPALTIHFVPEPNAAILMLLFGPTALSRRRRRPTNLIARN